jgi:hypothetical protein
MSLLQLICFLLDRLKEKEVEDAYDSDGYFFFDEDTGVIHRI